MRRSPFAHALPARALFAHALLAAPLVVLSAACHPRTPAQAATDRAAVARREAPVAYFAMTDRFFDGDPTNDANVDRTAPGAYHGGDLAGLDAKLPYLADLGVDVLWISPVVDNIDKPVDGAGFPDWGYHGYWAKDFTRPDEHQGSEADLRKLVEDAHARGIRVLLDVVLNHPGYGAPLGDDPAWTRSPARGDCGHNNALTECLYGLPDFKTEKPEVADALIGWHMTWARRSGVDGFRCDAVNNVGMNVWQKLAATARAERPGFLLLGEAWGLAPDNVAADYYLRTFDWVYDFAFADKVLRYVTGELSGGALGRWLVDRNARADKFVTFLDTHDTPGFLSRVSGDKSAFLLAAVLEMTTPGVPLIYYGDEVGRAGGEWPDNRGDMPWTPETGADPVLLGKYRQLVALHHRLRGPVVPIASQGGALLFGRSDVWIAVNPDRTPVTFDVPPEKTTELMGWGATLTPGSATSAGHLTVPARGVAVVGAAQTL